MRADLLGKKSPSVGSSLDQALIDKGPPDGPARRGIGCFVWGFGSGPGVFGDVRLFYSERDVVSTPATVVERQGECTEWR